MHRIISIGFILTLIFSGCGSNNNDNTSSDTTEQTNSSSVSQSSSAPETTQNSSTVNEVEDSQSILPTPLDDGTSSQTPPDMPTRKWR